MRYLRLLMLGAGPESIVALTFSRKAAGEFFNAILHRLAEAASSTAAAAALAKDIEQPGTTTDDFCQALVKMTARLPFLMLGTLDSFFIRMARSFPFELGLGGDFSLLDPHQQAVEKLRVYDRVFAPEAGPGTARKEFMQAFAEATHGKDEVSVRKKLDDFVQNWHSLFLSAPRAEQWGDPDTIWPEGSPIHGTGVDRVAVVEQIRTGMARAGLTPGQLERWEMFLNDALVHAPGGPFSKPLKYLLEKILEQHTALEAGSAVLTVERKKQTVDGPAAESLVTLCRDLAAGELGVVLRQTRGIYEVIRRYDRSYHELVRRQGRLTFHDVQLILGGGLSPEASGDPARTARELTHAENRQLMDYRLDARYDHWLLDEFQDTSRVQWKVLSNLIDEAVQDSEGKKSFFAVGDQKQSIYEWRGGTPRLFDEIERQYNSGAVRKEDRPIKIQPLSVSQRSGPAVIAMVNDLMGNKDALAEVLPPAAVAAWPWQEHTSRNTHYQGTALAIEVPDDEADETPAFETEGGPEGTDEEEVPDGDARWRRAAELLVELQPRKRGLTCAVLCHRNPRALALADFLRSATNMEVVCESDLSIARDNPATSALLALLQAAAHPGDSFAWQQVMMTPLARVIGREFPVHETKAAARTASSRKPVLRQVLGQVAELGFHDTLRWWVAALRKELRDLDAFSRSRLDELCGCAREFDLSGSRDVDEFLTFADSWTVRDAGHAGAIQVMTVHRSKGLTFDVVLIPDLHDRMFKSGHPLGTKSDAAGELEWLLKLPPKLLAESDPVLTEAIQRSEAAKWRERMAGLYVMVTRAKYANYLFLKPGSKKPSLPPSLAKTVRHLLTNGGAGEFSIGGKSYPLLAEYGNPQWFAGHALKPAGRLTATAPAKTIPASSKTVSVQDDLFAAPLPVVPAAAPRKGFPLRAKRPSGEAEAGSSMLFQSARQAAKEAGIAMHETFRRIEWWDTAPAALTGRDLDQAAVAEVQACLQEPGLLELFARPAGQAEAWRERAFDVIVNGVLHSGVFDRVMVQRDAAGRALSALLVDFKTGPAAPSAGEAALLHRPQIQRYRQALERLLGLPPVKIRAVVLFTATREAVDL